MQVRIVLDLLQTIGLRSREQVWLSIECVVSTTVRFRLHTF